MEDYHQLVTILRTIKVYIKPLCKIFLQNSNIQDTFLQTLKMMDNLDIKDRKILYQLDLNCRQSNAQIGKKVGLKRDVVAYRIKKLEDDGIINNYYTEIDTFRLGYNVFRLYINFQYVTSDLKNEIIKYFVDCKNSWVVASEKSEIYLDVVIWVKDIFESYQFWGRTLDKYEDYFANYDISVYVQAFTYSKSFLLEKIEDASPRRLFSIHCGGNMVEIDEIDYRLLNELAVNARIPLIDLANNLNITSQAVTYRIKNLIDKNIIRAFRVNINISLLNLQSFKIDIYLKDHKSINSIIAYLESKPCVEFINFAIDWSDLEPEIVVKDFNELLQFMDEINKKYPNAIKKQSFFITEKVYKLCSLPEMTFSN